MVSRGILEKTEAWTDAEPPLERLQVKNILCPVDFSDCSGRALRYAVGLARHFGSRLFVQHTTQPSTYLFLGGMEANAGMVDVETQIQAAREEVRRMLISAGVDTSEVTVLLNEGFVPQRITETISNEGIDLLVMGSHGHRGFNRLVLGSFAEDIVHQTVCPVLVVNRPQTDFVDPDQGERLRTILLATDFSRQSDRALAYALKWGSEWGSKVVLFHAVEETEPAMRGLVDLFPEYNPYFERQVADAWEKIAGLAPEAARQWCQVAYEVRQGNPKNEILRVADEQGADLIITGARGTGRSGAPWGSVSSAVVRDGRFPVLVVRDLSA